MKCRFLVCRTCGEPFLERSRSIYPEVQDNRCNPKFVSETKLLEILFTIL